MAKKHRVKKASHPGQGGTQTKLPQDREPPSITQYVDTGKQPLTHHGWGRGDIPTTPKGYDPQDAADRSKRVESNWPTQGHVSGIPLQVPPDLPSPSGGKSSALDFSDALMRGDPRATEALARSMADAKRDKNASLADQFMADSERQAGYWGFKGRKAKDFNEMLERYRNEMRRAHRFHLEDDFTAMATTISSSTDPKKLLYRLQYATLPYEITWLEFDPRVKIRVIHRMRGLSGRSIEGVPDRMGIMLYRINETDTLCQLFAAYPTSGRDLLAPHLTCYFFSTVERDFTKSGTIHFGASAMAMGTTDNNEPHIIQPTTPEELEEMADDPHNLSKGALWGYGPGPIGIIDSIEKFESLQAPSFLRRHGDSGQSRYCKALYAATDSDRLKESFGQMIQAELAEFGGFVRWIVTVLAMLNEIPVRNEHMQPVGQMRIGLTGRRRYLDYHRPTLRLPKTKPIEYIERKLRNVERARHRAHEVRSHWRTYLVAQPCSRETHDWEYDYEEGYRLCGKCMSFSTLVKEHVRGDPNLGWVKKEYVIKREQP